MSTTTLESTTTLRLLFPFTLASIRPRKMALNYALTEEQTPRFSAKPSSQVPFQSLKTPSQPAGPGFPLEVPSVFKQTHPGGGGSQPTSISLLLRLAGFLATSAIEKALEIFKNWWSRKPILSCGTVEARPRHVPFLHLHSHHMMITNGGPSKVPGGQT